MNRNSVCKYHLSGTCHGKSCSFSHQKPLLPQKSSKKVVCRYFPLGKCAYGDKCSRLHDVPVNGHSTKAASDGGSDRASHSGVGSNYSPLVGALDSQSDQSDAASNHERDNDVDSPHQEIQEPSSPPPPQDSGNLSDEEKSRSQCIFYSQGRCQAGDSCNFLHTSPTSTQEAVVNSKCSSTRRFTPSYDISIIEQTKPAKEANGQYTKIIYKHFQRGHCRLDDKCKHEHGLPNKGPMATDQPFGSDSPPASETHSPIFNDSQLDTSDTQMNTSVEYTNSPQEKWEDDRSEDEGSQPDGWERERDAEVLDNQPPIQSFREVPLDANDTNTSEDQSGQWKSDSSNFEQSSRNISQGLQTSSDRAREVPQPGNSDKTRKRKGPGSFYGEGWSEEESGSPQWPISSPTNGFLDEHIQPTPVPVYPHVSEVMPHWSQFADPLANPTVPFCKPHAQGQCTQGDSCKFRHSLTPQEYTLLFLDQQPNLWTLQQTSSNDAHKVFEHHTEQYVTRMLSVQQPAIVSQNSKLPPTTSRLECAFYSRGKCLNGKECPFRHTGPPPEAPTMRPEPNGGSYERTYTQKTKVCKYFANGNCIIGSGCKFLHEGNSDNGKELSGPTPSSEPANGQLEDNNKWGSSWDENNANAGDWGVVEDNSWGAPVDHSGWGIDNESSTHPKNENSAIPQNESSALPKLQTCYQFSNHGFCRWDTNCKFSHDVEPTPTVEEKKGDSGWLNNNGDYAPSGSRSESPVLPCPYFLKGHCKDEETCNYRHDLNDCSPDADRQLNHAMDYQNDDRHSHTPDQPTETEEEDDGWNKSWPVEEPTIRTRQFKINTPCKRFGQGYCHHADKCRYLHIDHTEPEVSSILRR